MVLVRRWRLADLVQWTATAAAAAVLRWVYQFGDNMREKKPCSVESRIRFGAPAYVAGISVALLCSRVAAIAAEETNSGSDVCAQREALLLTLVEAHGAAPNFASDKLAAEYLALAQTRSACDNGHAKDAAGVYDRLIDELTVSLNGAK